MPKIPAGATVEKYEEGAFSRGLATSTSRTYWRITRLSDGLAFGGHPTRTAAIAHAVELGWGEPEEEVASEPEPTGYCGNFGAGDFQLSWRADLGTWWVGFWNSRRGGTADSWTTLPAEWTVYQAAAHLEAQGYRGNFTRPVTNRFGGARP